MSKPHTYTIECNGEPSHEALIEACMILLRPLLRRNAARPQSIEKKSERVLSEKQSRPEFTKKIGSKKGNKK